MGVYSADVPLRWSDMDAYGHLNHARTVTLIEEARAGLLFGEAGKQGLDGMAEGMVVARVVIDYHAPVLYSAGSLRVEMTTRDVKAASFVVDYTTRVGEAVVATAETLMVPYDLGAERPRRLTTDERDFLLQWSGFEETGPTGG